MTRRNLPSDLFLAPETDRVTSVFRLLFAFMRDETCEDLYDCESVLSEILCGLRLPPGGRERLRVVYREFQREPELFEHELERAAPDLRRDRDLLLAVIGVLIRLSVDDGIICRRSSVHIRKVLRLFDVTAGESATFSPSERGVLDYVQSTGGEPGAEPADAIPRVLLGHYRVLGCSPASTIGEVRRAYRKLVMAHHPDRAAHREPDLSATELRHRFQLVQEAYEAVRAAHANVPGAEPDADAAEA